MDRERLPAGKEARGRLRTLHAGLRQVSRTRLLPSHLCRHGSTPGLTLNLSGEEFTDAWLPALARKDAGEGSRITGWGARDTAESRSALVLFSTKSWQVFLKWTPCLIFKILLLTYFNFIVVCGCHWSRNPVAPCGWSEKEKKNYFLTLHFFSLSLSDRDTSFCIKLSVPDSPRCLNKWEGAGSWKGPGPVF